MKAVKKIYKIVFLSVVVLVIVFQLLLLNENFKNKISLLYNIESKYAYSEQDLKKGEITIKISAPSSEVYVMENGERTVKFDKETITLDIYDNTVIEIDGRDFNDNISVEILNISDNIDGFYEKKINVCSDITILGRFLVK
ncbi:MAG: hypothetical protein IJQ28_07605 [Clostridia bacterium]|nr:hypothetical protein [Clostridia bacterium]